MPYPTALGGISQEWYKQARTLKFYTYCEQLAPQICRIRRHYCFQSAKMQLNTAKKCIKWVRLAMSRLIRPLFNVESPNYTRTSIHLCRPTIRPHRLRRHQLLHVGIYRRSKKTAENAVSDGFGSNLSSPAFCMAHQLPFDCSPCFDR